ncbi:MAG: hypothetical protein ABR568_08980 [Pyrinomonadaceae bacterium]
MVDEEVENTLREIRERVRKTAELEAEVQRPVVSGAVNASLSLRESSTKTPETMARIDAYLTTTGRAWDQLPPLVSNRSGGLARLELWVKKRFKQATRWYSWEQVNFNAAVHHALRDALDALLDLEQQLGQLRAETTAEREARAQQLKQRQIEMMTQRAEIESQRLVLESQRAEMEACQAQMADQRALSLEVDARLADLVRELREYEGQGLDEQRVCFKQLSLEISEAEVLFDRARRDLESRLDKLEKKRKS